MSFFAPIDPVSNIMRGFASEADRKRGEELARSVHGCCISHGRITCTVVDGRMEIPVWIAFEARHSVDFGCPCATFAQTQCCPHCYAAARAADAMIDKERRLLLKLFGPAVGLAMGASLGSGSRNSQKQPKTPEWRKIVDALTQEYDLRHPVALHRPADVFPAGNRVIYRLKPSGYAYEPLTVTVCREAPARRGGWEKSKQLAPEQWAAVPDEQDQQIRQMLIARGLRDGRDERSAVDIALSGAGLPSTLKLLIGTGRAVVRLQNHGRGTSTDRPAVWDADEPYDLILQGALDAGHVVVAPVLQRGASRTDFNNVAETVHDFHFLIDGRVIRTVGVTRGAMGAVHRHFPVKVPAAQATDLGEALRAVPALPPVRMPEQIGIPTLSVTPTPRLHVAQSRSDQRMLEATVLFAYGTHHLPASDERRSPVMGDGKDRSVLLRMIDQEAKYLEQISAMGLRPSYEREVGKYLLGPSRLVEVVLTLRDSGWHVEAEGKLYRSARSINIQVSSGIDWFDVRGSASFDEIDVPLPEILNAIRDGRNTITLGDGTVGLLPEEWLRKYAGLSGASDVRDDALRFKPTQAALLDALLTQLPDVQIDRQFGTARERLSGFKQVTPMDAPDSFVGTLRPYQREGLGWLHYLNRFKFGGCLADDMGLGKTIQVLALLESRRLAGAGPSLVVAPRSLIFNWKSEAAKFTPHMRVLDFSDAERKKAMDRLGEYDLVLTTYGLLRTDAPLLKDFTFDYAILDEAQAIKNAATASAKAARLINANHRLAMTGTPIENHLGELWSLFDFLNPGMFGAGSGFKVLAGANQGNDASAERALISRTIRPFILRRTKKQVATDLPDRIEQTLYCELEPKQRKVYDELREHYRASLLKSVEAGGINKAQIQILQALLRLRQAACSTALIDPKHVNVPSAKIDTLMEKLIEAADEGHKVLVFSQFTSLLALVRKELAAKEMSYEYLDGQTRDRQAKVQRFQSDKDCPVFLISLKAGGVGLNLTAADYVFLLDPWWNPAAEAQAIDRTHRIGQHRTVMAYRIIAKDTVEEKVLELQRTKRELADAIIGDSDKVSAAVTREDLELLLS